MSSRDPLEAPAPLKKPAIVVVCRDSPNGSVVRATQTAEHMAYIETVLTEISIAGPLYDDSGQHPIGSLYCLHTASEDRAREIIENDPYYRNGAFVTVEYFPFLPAAGNYIGGKIW